MGRRCFTLQGDHPDSIRTSLRAPITYDADEYPLLIIKSAQAPRHIFGGFISIIDLLSGAFRVIYVVPQKGNALRRSTLWRSDLM
jgi:hypothetical protein